MKKSTLLCMTALCCASFSMPAMAQPESASTEIFDFGGFSETKLLNLFYDIQQEGRQFPTEEELNAIGITKMDLEFVRSHVRPRTILSRANRVVQKTFENRQLFMNIPMGTAKTVGGYPSSTWNNDTYSLWNYTTLFGSWNHGLFQAPGAWVDAGHKHGTDVLSGIKFFESWTPGSGDEEYTRFISTRDEEGNYKYVKPFINCLMFFGSDGINYNWEDNSYTDEDVTQFHKALWREAEAQGFTNFHAAMYTMNPGLSVYSADQLYATTENGKTFDCFLNYSGGDFSTMISMNGQAAIEANGTTEGLYQGAWIVNMNRRWSYLDRDEYAHQVGICLWGEHANSRFWSYNEGGSNQEAQANYQMLLERAFSGGNRNPANRPVVSDGGNNWQFERSGETVTKYPLQTFCGLSEFIPERSTVSGDLPFQTHFNLGNGEFYLYKGKQTTGSWYNLGMQDMMPTYRWLVYQAGSQTVDSKIQPAFTHRDAYLGGSCLELTGESSTTGTDIVLYQTELKVSGSNPVAKIAVKTAQEGTTDTNLSVILKKQGSDAWMEFPVGATTSKNWEEKVVDLSALATNDVITYVGLRVKSQATEAYDVKVGKLELSDNRTATPSDVKDLMVEVKEETKRSLSVKLKWDVEGTGDRANWDLLYNDEANIDHFEVLYKNGENGRISEIGRTSQWATYIGNIKFEGADDQPYVGVRAASVDMKSYSPIVWVSVPRANQDELKDLVEDNYGKLECDPTADGYETACQQRYLETVTTTGADQDLNYTASGPQEDKTQYVNALDHVLKVHQGQEVTLKFKAYNGSDGLKYCFANGYIDWDGNSSFNGEYGSDEVLFRHGEFAHSGGYAEMQTSGLSFTFKVPEDAAPGNSRLRLAFSDLWFAPPVPSGLTNKGFSIDFTVEITGDNPARDAQGGTLDEGVADEPEALNDNPTSIENANNEFSKAELGNGSINFQQVEKAWIYTADGKLVNYVKNPSAVSTQGYAPGTYVVKMLNQSVIRTQKLVIK